MATGYRNRRVLTATEHVPVIIEEKEAGRVAVAAILPKVDVGAGSGPETNS